LTSYVTKADFKGKSVKGLGLSKDKSFQSFYTTLFETIVSESPSILPFLEQAMKEQVSFLKTEPVSSTLLAKKDQSQSRSRSKKLFNDSSSHHFTSNIGLPSDEN